MLHHQKSITLYCNFESGGLSTTTHWCHWGHSVIELCRSLGFHLGGESLLALFHLPHFSSRICVTISSYNCMPAHTSQNYTVAYQLSSHFPKHMISVLVSSLVYMMNVLVTRMSHVTSRDGNNLSVLLAPTATPFSFLFFLTTKVVSVLKLKKNITEIYWKQTWKQAFPSAVIKFNMCSCFSQQSYEACSCMPIEFKKEQPCRNRDRNTHLVTIY